VPSSTAHQIIVAGREALIATIERYAGAEAEPACGGGTGGDASAAVRRRATPS
jgi:hypothetical protein